MFYDISCGYDMRQIKIAPIQENTAVVGNYA
jgi:hypothetical protein